MKKLILSTLTLAILVTAPAHAINAKYRAQLERSGCTQITEADGTCDIHKTKAQNAATAKPKTNDAHAGQIRAMGEDMLGTKAGDAAAVMKTHGFQQTDPGIWYNPKTNDVIKTTIRDGVISTITINK
ncbi:hypothetical protein [Citrobacter sp. Marseille-Q6884]|uniref:hypothetical protein n=1 Tax=Citrobacter sp. Marseille-Q6884 TaxID=2956786 RepID=UPI0021B2E6E3|nr:hypothetical protein [Citrobacter sp. Marseille-Q6884]EMF0717951.1 hypothetical protein [Citrobacter freundii]